MGCIVPLCVSKRADLAEDVGKLAGEMKTQANHALQRTRPSRPGCNPRVPRAGSLSLGRSATESADFGVRRCRASGWEPDGRGRLMKLDDVELPATPACIRPVAESALLVTVRCVGDIV